LEPGEDLGIEILADVEGGSVYGICPELLLVRPELGLRLDGRLERVRRGEVGFDAGVDAEANGVVGLADLPLHAEALHLLRNSASFSVATRDSREAENSCLLSCGEEKKLRALVLWT